MSGEAAKEITDILDSTSTKVKEIIAEIQKNITPLINESTEKISEGKEIANFCASSFNTIETESLKINEMILETSVAFKEQTVAVNEITKAIESLDVLGRKNADSARINSTQASHLKNEAEDLTEVTQKLNVIVNGNVA